MRRRARTAGLYSRHATPCSRCDIRVRRHGRPAVVCADARAHETYGSRNGRRSDVARHRSLERRPDVRHRWRSGCRRRDRQTGKAPERELSSRVLEGHLNAAHKEECSFSDLRAGATGRTYATPSGVALNATYINYLRRTLPTRSVRFRTTAPIQPVVVVENGNAVAVLMPVKQ